MAEAIPWEIRIEAKELYATEGMTYDQVANATGVSVSQLKKWGKDESWADARKEFREAYTSIKRNTVKLRAGLLQKALDTKDPQSVYAFVWLERAVTDKNRGAAPVATPNIKEIKTPKDAVEALQDVVKTKLNNMLSQPDTMQLSQVKDVKQSMELIDKLKTKYDPDDKESKVDGGLSDEAVELIKQEILGVS